jgi:hypothetical protein
MTLLDNGGFIGRTADYSANDFYQITGTVPRGEQEYTTPGTYSWTAPTGVTSVCVVCVGGGGGGVAANGSGGNGGSGGGLGWKNNITVVPGQSYTVVVGSGGTALNSTTTGATAGAGGDSYFINTSTVAGFGGLGGVSRTSISRAGGSYTGDGGGNGGSVQNSNSSSDATGGGGAGGYSGNGGAGASINSAGSAGSGSSAGGGGAGGSSDAAGAGGGVGIYGEGAAGAGGSYSGSNGGPGGGGSGGAGGSWSPGSSLRPSTGGSFGGGGGGAEFYNENGPGGGGAVRIIWGGDRAFPSTNTADGQGSTTGTTNANKKNSGLWNLDSIFISKAPVTVFTDTFETFTGWTTVGSGAVSQSSTQAYAGTYSAYKTTNGDPNGAYKLLDASVNREYRLEAWIFSEEPRAGGGADRISIVDASGNGYGYRDGGSAFGVETRTAYTGSDILGTAGTWTRPVNAWYRIVLEAKSDNTFTVSTYNSSGTLLGTYTSPVDTTHSGPFDRVAILGGNDYYVDNLVVKRTFT